MSYKIVIQAAANHVVDQNRIASTSGDLVGCNFYRSPDGATCKKINASMTSPLYEPSTVKEDPSKGVKLPRAENCAGRRVQCKVLSPSQSNSIAGKLSEPYATLVLVLPDT